MNITPLKSRTISKVLISVGIIYFVFNLLAPIKPTSSFLPSQSRSKSIDEQEIPKKIWQTWHTPSVLLADEDRERVRTWLKKNPNYQYELLTDKSAESFVRHHFSDEALLRDVFLNLTDTILRADFLRYLVLLAEGGLYTDLDVECREPIDTWIPSSLQGALGAVIGIESDRMPVENDKRLYYDFREYVWGITNWTFMSKRGHPFMRFVAEQVAKNLVEYAQKNNQPLSAMDLSYKEVIDVTGPRAFTEAFLAYTSNVSGRRITYADATMLEEPKLIGDILILPIRAMSAAEADRTGVEGAHSVDWPAVIFHWSVGSWKKTHFQQAAPQTDA